MSSNGFLLPGVAGGQGCQPVEDQFGRPREVKAAAADQQRDDVDDEHQSNTIRYFNRLKNMFFKRRPWGQFK